MASSVSERVRGAAHSVTRDLASLALVVVASVLAALAIVSVYVDRNLTDTARFADRAQQTLKSDAVRRVAAERITRDVIERVDPDAISVRPLVESATGAIIDTTAFRRLFRTGVVEFHRAALDNDRDSALLLVANIGVLVEQAMRKLDPPLAKRVPADLGAGLVRASEGGFATDIAQRARANHWLAIVLPLLSLLGFVLAVALAPERRRALARCGIGVAVAALSLAVLYQFAEAMTLHRVADGLDRDAAQAVWDAFLLDFFVLTVGIAVAGTALAAAATGSLRASDVTAQLGERVRVALTPPKRTGWRVLWAVAVLLLGVWALSDPLGALRAIGLVAGFVLLVRGFDELIAIAVRGDARAAETAGGAGRTRIVRFVVVAAIALIGAGALGAAIAGSSGLPAFISPTNRLGCNGATQLCDKSLDKVAFATTHNSMSDATAPGWLFGEQDGPISQQLADGVRGLMLDVYFGFPGTRVYTDTDLSAPSTREQAREEFGLEFVAAADRIRRQISKPQNVAKRLYFCHGFCELGALPVDKGLGQIEQFLKDNPREVVVLAFEDHVPVAAIGGALEQAGIDKQVYKGPWRAPFPTLGQMIDRDRRVVVLAENGTAPSYPWIHSVYDLLQETPYTFRTIDNLRSDTSCRPNRGAPANPLFLVNHWIEARPVPRPSIAERVNAQRFLGDRIARCERIRGHRANLVAVDFYKRGDLMDVVDDLNGVR